MKIGNARVSTAGQDMESQKDRLQAEGCERLFVEKVTDTSTAPRKALAAMLDHVRAGDTVYITKIDRLARSIIDLNKIVEELIDRGVSIVFINENLTFKADEKANEFSRLMFNILGSFAQF